VSGEKNKKTETSTKARNLYRQSHLTLTPARRDLGLALRIRFSILNKKAASGCFFL
jgi:hypothetical protein